MDYINLKKSDEEKYASLRTTIRHHIMQWFSWDEAFSDMLGQNDITQSDIVPCAQYASHNAVPVRGTHVSRKHVYSRKRNAKRTLSI